MNIKKQLRKIAEYVEHLENDNVFLDGKVAELEQQPYQSYVDLVAENKRLRETLRWYPMGELPTLDHGCVSKWSKNVVFQVDRIIDPEIAFYDYHVCYWRNLKTMEKIKTFPGSRWCYIPADIKESEE